MARGDYGAYGTKAHRAWLWHAFPEVGQGSGSREQVARFFDGLEMIPPGLVPIAQWGLPSQIDTTTTGGLIGYCGIGQKPLLEDSLI